MDVRLQKTINKMARQVEAQALEIQSLKDGQEEMKKLLRSIKQSVVRKYDGASGAGGSGGGGTGGGGGATS